MKRWAAFIVSAAAFAAMCVFVFVMSAAPADDSTELSMGFVWRLISLVVPGYDQMTTAEQLFWQETLDHGVRKTAHFLEYMALGALALNMLHQWFRTRREAARPEGRTMPSPKLVATTAWMIATLYAATDELHQIFVPGRTGKITDILIDSAGALLGVLLVALILRAIEKHSARRNA